MTFRLFICLLGLATLVSPAASAELERRGPTLTLKAGTSGLGAEVTYGLNHIVRVRAGGYGFVAGFDTSTTDISYDMDLRLLSGAGYVDIHPFKGRFRLTAGLVYNANRLDAVGLVNQEFVVGDNSFTPQQVGRLEGHVDFRRWSPYAGIGWGSPLSKESNWSFEADLGVMYQNRPDVELMSVGGDLSNDPVLINAIEEEEQELEDEIGFFRFYPIVSLGVGYTF